MAIKKVTDLTELTTNPTPDDLYLVVDTSAPVSDQTKKIRSDKMYIHGSSQIAAGVVDYAAIKDANVTEAKLATGAVTTNKILDATITDAKLASIDKTLLVRLLASDELTSLRTWTNEFLFPPSLNGLVIKAAYATLAAPSTSGSVVVAVKNNGNTVTTLTIAAGEYYSPGGSINASYRTITQFHGASFQITSAGTGAKGLSVILVVGRA